MMRRGCIVWCLLFISVSAFGMDLEIPSSFNPVGSGARAVSIGGAFIAAADDATAASWNPGGLIQLRTSECSLVVSGFGSPKEIVVYSVHSIFWVTYQ